MKAIVTTSAAAAICLLLAGCGELSQRNELFSTAVDRTTIAPSRTLVASASPAMATRPTAPAVRTAEVRSDSPAGRAGVDQGADNSEGRELQVAALDRSESRDVSGPPPARPGGTAQPAEAVTAAGGQETSADQAVAAGDGSRARDRENEVASVESPEGQAVPRPTLRAGGDDAAAMRQEPPEDSNAKAGGSVDTGAGKTQLATVDPSERESLPLPTPRSEAVEPEGDAAPPAGRNEPPEDSPAVAGAPEASGKGGAQLSAIDPSEQESLPRPTSRPDDHPDSSGGADTAKPEAQRGAPPLATRDQIIAGLLRTWNRVADKDLSSKVLFGVWPEELDGVPPAPDALEKRGQVTDEK